MSDNRTIALVADASTDLGREFCRQLAARCDVIIAVARHRKALAALRDELAGQTAVQPVEADLGTVEGAARTMEILRQKGPVDILVNNAGTASCGAFADASIEEQRELLSLHCDALITLCRAALPFMRQRGGGAIVNVSAVDALLPHSGTAVFAATQAFISTFSRALAAEVAADGIEVQLLSPGPDVPERVAASLTAYAPSSLSRIPR